MLANLEIVCLTVPKIKLMKLEKIAVLSAIFQICQNENFHGMISLSTLAKLIRFSLHECTLKYQLTAQALLYS